MRVAQLLIAGLVSVLVWGCASAGPQLVSREDLLRSVAAVGIDPSTLVVPFELTAEIREWAHERVGRGSTNEMRLQQLLTHLLHGNEVQLSYRSDYTGTAAEAFESGSANCLAFTNLFVGLARELGLGVFFVRVSGVDSYVREGDLGVISGHVAAGFHWKSEYKIYDFSENQSGDYAHVAMMSDQEAIAVFYSNRGAESLFVGEAEQALEWLRTAVKLAPELAGSWNNLGVALRRSGELQEAEAAYRRAMEIDPGEVPAYSNMASLLRSIGRQEEAAELLALVDSADHGNPFSYLALGDLALERGRLAEAGRYYEKARRRFRDSADPIAALGRAALERGKIRKAQKLYRRAIKIDPESPRARNLGLLLTDSG